MLENVENQVRNMILDICEVLARNGFERISVGALMRLVGMDNESASALDNEYMDIDHTFIEIARSQYSPVQFPPTSYNIQ